VSKLRLPLIISIILNVFLVGAIVGGLVSLRAPKPHPVVNLRQAARQLPEPERGDLQRALQTTRVELRQTFRGERQARREAAALLEQPSLDTTALLAALQRVREADIAIRAKLEEQIVAFAATRSLDVRRLLAERIARHIPTLPEKN
jgi:uncharacterized membrane protein